MRRCRRRISHINGVRADVRILDEPTGGTAVSGDPYVVHHMVSGRWKSRVEVTDPKQCSPRVGEPPRPRGHGSARTG
ncbi:hypothetical protein [Streptomyces sp. NPDC002044]|uniref:hypothetical protein n=1 Tax=Streptomyces sp. NPDC002044 TaxID=3154662 RepID=UPI003317D98B